MHPLVKLFVLVEIFHKGFLLPLLNNTSGSGAKGASEPDGLCGVLLYVHRAALVHITHGFSCNNTNCEYFLLM